MKLTVSLIWIWLVCFSVHGVTIFNDTENLIEITFEYHAQCPRPTYKQVIGEKYLVQAPFPETTIPSPQREIILHPGQGFNKKQIKSFQLMVRRGPSSWKYVGELRDLDDYLGVIISESDTKEIVWKKFIVDGFTVVNYMSHAIDMSYRGNGDQEKKESITAKNSLHALPITWEKTNNRWMTTIHFWLKTAGAKTHRINLSLENDPSEYLGEIIIVHGDGNNVKFTTTASLKE